MLRQEVAAFYEGIQAGANGEDVPVCPFCEDQGEPLDALFRKGKGKCKGKRGKGFGGSASDGGKGGQSGGVQGGGFSGPHPFAPLRPVSLTYASAIGACGRAMV